MVTDGECSVADCNDATLQAAGDDLRALGVTVVGVGIGDAALFIDQLEIIASKKADGTPFVIFGAEFDEIESILVGTLQAQGVYSADQSAPAASSP